MNILITGTNSFIGNNFVQAMNRSKFDCEIEKISLRDEKWKSKSFKGYDAIVHVAAIVHQSEKMFNYDIYQKVNHQLTFELATKAKEEGVKQFIFLSTMSVYGLNIGRITADTPLNPVTFYGRSKLAAEQALQDLSSEEFHIAIIRPPIVYGANNQGNFKTLTKIALSSPIFPRIDNERSVIYIDNLSDFIKQVIEKDLQGILFPQNDEYMKTSEAVTLIAKSYSKKVQLSSLLGLAIKPLMFSNILQKAFGSLTYDPNLSGGPNQLDYNKLSFNQSIEKIASDEKSNIVNSKLMTLQRPLDIMFSATGLVVALPLLIGATAIGYLDTGSPLFIQERVGKDQKPFKLIKFRTMKVTTESVASHLVDNTSITKLGKVLRKTKLDELPQLINVLKGEMSLVGPRPNLFNQNDLIEAREQMGVYNVLPGITGLAQLSGVDMSTPELLAKTDKEMVDNLTLKNYFSYIVRTALGKGSGDAVK